MHRRMVFQFARDAYYRSDIYNRMLRRHGAAQMHSLATDPIPGDPARGTGIMNGEMVLAARIRSLGPHPFDTGLKSPRAVAELYGFSWLRDLAALSVPDARDGAQALIRDWLRHHDRWDPLTWSPGTIGTRLLAWINHIDFVTESGAATLREDMAQSAAAQLRHLARTGRIDKDRSGDDAAPFTAAAALIAGAVALPGHEPLLATGLDRLHAGLAGGVLDDGGHRSRSPEMALTVLGRLVEARRALTSGRRPIPEFLTDTLARMTPAVKSWVLGDGTLASFNGGGGGTASDVTAMLSAGGVRASAASSLTDCGFERLHAGSTTIVTDAGGHGGAHAGAMSFEMSSGRHHLVVNCGAHPDDTTEWSQVLRSTAAHSTLAINDTDTLPTNNVDRADIAMSVRRNEREGSTLVQMGHAGYLDAFGIVHNRDLYLSCAGDDFRGKDTLVGGAGAFTVRFHLHPNVGASVLAGGDAVLLKQPGGKGWRFRCSGSMPELEESVYLGDPAHPRRCQQIVLRGDHRGEETAIRWSFLREGA